MSSELLIDFSDASTSSNGCQIETIPHTAGVVAVAFVTQVRWSQGLWISTTESKKDAVDRAQTEM
jgi:hypothetical protein